MNIIVVVYLFWYYYYVKSGPSFLKFIYIDGIPPNFSIMFGLWMEGMREEKRESDGRGLNKSYLDFLLKSEREGFFFFLEKEREGFEMGKKTLYECLIKNEEEGFEENYPKLGGEMTGS